MVNNIIYLVYGFHYQHLNEKSTENEISIIEAIKFQNLSLC